MASTTRDRIDRWLGELLAVASQGEAVAIVLVHAAVDQSQRTVKTWKLGDAVENLDALVGEIDEVAEGDAEGLGGRQRYVLRAQARGREVGSLTLRYEYRPDDGPAVDSEPATAAGTIAVLQRHAEGAMRMMVQSFGGVIESYKEQVNAQKALIADFQKQAAENFRLQEELASRKIEQQVLLDERQTHLQLTAAREVSELEKSQMLWVESLRQLSQFVPVVMHMLTNGQIGKSPAEAAEEKRRAEEEQLFGNANDETIEKWRQTLSADQFAELMDRLRAYRAAHARAEAPPPGGPDDADVAAGADRLYRALRERVGKLQSLAVALMARQAFSAISPEQARLIEEIATTIVGEGPHISAAQLWAALCSRKAREFLPIVEALTGGKAWNDLAPASKVQLIAIVRKALQLATTGENRRERSRADA